MTALADWPALRQGLPLSHVVYERAVWGKMHGAPTDFRWIARSANFAIDSLDLQRRLNLGSEDVPAHFQAWRNLGDRCYAVTIYPSRAQDEAGRRGFLEKQLLEWRRPPGVHAALGALVLMPRVSALTDAIWWDRDGAELRADPHAVLSIASRDHEPFAFSEDDLAETIERGRQLLRESVTPQSLESFYEQLLAGRRPACLAGLERPLAAEALAALLLPLPPDVADRVSVAGWIPAARPALQDLGDRWDALVLAREHAGAEAVATASGQARELAQALLVLGQPQFARPVAPIPSVTRAPAVAAPSRPFTPGFELRLTPADPDAPPVIQELYRFAVAANRRWLSPDGLKRVGGALRFAAREPDAQVLCKWVQEVREQRPDYANKEQWAVKVDLLRSAAIVLVPEPSTLELVGTPDTNDRVPALLFGLTLKGRSEWDPLAGYREDDLRRLLEHTVSRADTGWAPPLRRWLEKWSEESTRVDVNVRRVIRDVLATHRL